MNRFLHSERTKAVNIIVITNIVGEILCQFHIKITQKQQQHYIIFDKILVNTF